MVVLDCVILIRCSCKNNEEGQVKRDKKKWIRYKTKYFIDYNKAMYIKLWNQKGLQHVLKA